MLRIAAILTSDRRKEVKTATIRNLIPPNETYAHKESRKPDS